MNDKNGKVTWPIEQALWEGPVLEGVADGKGKFKLSDGREDNVKYDKGRPDIYLG